MSDSVLPNCELFIECCEPAPCVRTLAAVILAFCCAAPFVLVLSGLVVMACARSFIERVCFRYRGRPGQPYGARSGFARRCDATTEPSSAALWYHFCALAAS